MHKQVEQFIVHTILPVAVTSYQHINQLYLSTNHNLVQGDGHFLACRCTLMYCKKSSPGTSSLSAGGSVALGSLARNLSNSLANSLS